MQELIMIGTRWDRVLSNVRDFIAVRDAHGSTGGNRCRVTFQLTFLEQNVRELADIVRLAIALGVDRVKGHHLWAHFDAIKQDSMRRDTQAIELWNQAVRAAQAVAYEHNRSNAQRILLENIFPLYCSGSRRPCARWPLSVLGSRSMGQRWRACFYSCCAPDAQRRTLGDFGNLHERSLPEIWNSPEYRHLVATYRTRALCLSCNMRRPTDQK